MSRKESPARLVNPDEEAFLDAIRDMGLSDEKARQAIDDDKEEPAAAETEEEERPSGKVKTGGHGVRESITVGVKDLLRNQLSILRDLAKMPDDIFRDLENRPRVRADCEVGGKWAARPCPFVACKWNIFLDVDPETGSIIFNFPDKDFDEIPATCALDVAKQSQLNGGMALEEVGLRMNLTRERIRQVEESACGKLKEHEGHKLNGIIMVNSIAPLREKKSRPHESQTDDDGLDFSLDGTFER